MRMWEEHHGSTTYYGKKPRDVRETRTTLPGYIQVAMLGLYHVVSQTRMQRMSYHEIWTLIPELLPLQG